MSGSGFKNGMVTAPHFLASEAGLSVLKDGGNAIEAAVAMASSLAVVYPHMTGIGGDGFWLIKSPEGEIFTIDACGQSAAKIDLQTYEGLETIPFRGGLAAITVPGTIAGWKLALNQCNGDLPLERLLRDAIKHAEEGVVITKSGADTALAKDDELKSFSGYGEVFRPAGKALKEGDVLYQPKLAWTLKALVQNGLDDFYRGEIAKSMSRDLERLGSPISVEDLACYSAVKLKPLSAKVSGAKLYNMGPPTQGFVSLLILALNDRLDWGFSSRFASIHGIVEATKQAVLTYKAINLGDRKFLLEDPQALLDDDAFLDHLAEQISSVKARNWPEDSQPGDTTWFGVMDNQGWSVSAIQSTYFEFGSGLVLPETGVVWQNRGASFRLSDTGWNTLKPGRKPFHTLNPALAIFEDGREMVYGTMGGEGQPQTQAAIFSRYASGSYSLQDAISAPRWLLGRTWGDDSTSLKLEEGFDESVYADLKRAGHEVEIVSACNEVMGHAGALVRNEDIFDGASDPRSDGAALGW